MPDPQRAVRCVLEGDPYVIVRDDHPDVVELHRGTRKLELVRQPVADPGDLMSSFDPTLMS